MGEYEQRQCEKCSKMFDVHYLGPFRAICPACCYRIPPIKLRLPLDTGEKKP